MSRIRFLDDRLISQIAAGEVVERPASVVKELVENCLDAGATEVRVALVAGGKRALEVRDDGVGMDRDDALLAFDRHATSKLDTFEDLERIGTLGFRGEALASIAAVARVELRTAREPGDGHLVRIEGGRVRKSEPVSCPRGTRIEVASLFWNVPARRKFLKRPQTELRRCVEVLQGYALAHPERRFLLEHEGRTLVDAVPTTDDEDGRRERIGQIFGRSLVDHLVPIRGPEGVGGFVGDPETTRGRRIFLFVNRRLVRDRILLARFYRAVREEWKADEQPALFLFLEIPPEDVDVNVHPQKAEVRFRDLAVADRVESALRDALARARGEEEAPLRPPEGRPWAPTAWEGLGGSGEGQVREGTPPEAWWRPDVGPPAEGADGLGFPTGGAGVPGSSPSHGLGVPSGGAPGEGPRIALPSFRPPEPRTVPLSGRSGEVRPFRLLGQYKGSLLLLEGPDGLYLIDQHVAHERILYERFRKSLSERSTPSQRLLEPVLLELGRHEVLRLEELAESLSPCGFEVQVLSGNSAALTSVPVDLSVDQSEALLRQLASSSDEASGDGEALRTSLMEALAASLACRAAIKIHRPMPFPEMERLVTELFASEHPYACPHGRPVVLRMTDVELERRFGRR